MKRGLKMAAMVAATVLMTSAAAWAAPPEGGMQAAAPAHHGGEANLILPDLSQGSFLGVNGHTLLFSGIAVAVLGLLFGLAIFSQLKNAPVHSSMLEISELIYETCKAYLIQQGKMLVVLELVIGACIVVYFGALMHLPFHTVAMVFAFSCLGILGSFAVAAFGMRINNYANARTAFA